MTEDESVVEEGVVEESVVEKSALPQKLTSREEIQEVMMTKPRPQRDGYGRC